MSRIKKLNRIGWREFVNLPDLGIANIKAKIDTGARTSALHSEIVKIEEMHGGRWVTFDVPLTGSSNVFRSKAKIVDQRPIKNTSGVPEERIVIKTTLRLGEDAWPIELSLADRQAMKFDLILGRTAIQNRNFIVDPGRSFLVKSKSVSAK